MVYELYLSEYAFKIKEFILTQGHTFITTFKSIIDKPVY